MRYRDMVLPIMVSVLPGGGDALAKLGKPVLDYADGAGHFFLLLHRISNHEPLAVGRDVVLRPRLAAATPVLE